MEQQSPPRRLLRSQDDRVIAGVCGGLAEYTGIDPVVFRVVLAVAAFAGGAGLFAYVIAWIAMPERRADGSEPPLRQLEHGSTIAVVVLGALFLLAVLDGADRGPWDGDGGLLLLALAGAGLWWWTRQERPPVPPTPPGAPPVPPAPSPSYEPHAGGLDDLLSPPDPTWSAAPPPPPVPRSSLPLVGVSSLLLLVGALILVDLAVTEVDPQVGVALALVAVGGVLVVGAWYGRARGLIVIGVLLTIVGGLSSVIDVQPRGGFGDRFWEATSTEDLRRSYRLAGGEAVLDLSELELDRTRDVDVDLWAGELRIVVPPDTNVDVDAHVGLGELRVLGETEEGIDVEKTVTIDEGEGPVLRLDVNVGMGELEVVRAAA